MKQLKPSHVLHKRIVTGEPERALLHHRKNTWHFVGTVRSGDNGSHTRDWRRVREPDNSWPDFPAYFIDRFPAGGQLRFAFTVAHHKRHLQINSVGVLRQERKPSQRLDDLAVIPAEPSDKVARAILAQVDNDRQALQHHELVFRLQTERLVVERQRPLWRHRVAPDGFGRVQASGVICSR